MYVLRPDIADTRPIFRFPVTLLSFVRSSAHPKTTTTRTYYYPILRPTAPLTSSFALHFRLFGIHAT